MSWLYSEVLLIQGVYKADKVGLIYSPKNYPMAGSYTHFSAKFIYDWGVASLLELGKVGICVEI